MHSFNTQEHQAVKSKDGSYTAYSKTFNEHYHSTKDGALHESMSKHVLPALKHCQDKEEITILDICFGLGFNTLATLYALKGSDKRVRIYSPEFDADLVRSLTHFTYPEEFHELTEVIQSLSQKQHYRTQNIDINIYLGDARVFVRETDIKFDVVYQDAFSPSANPMLWTREYFGDIAALMKEDAILTTYSTALATRIALYKNGLKVFLHKGEGFRNATLASKSPLPYEKVDVEHKMRCNPDTKALRDEN